MDGSVFSQPFEDRTALGYPNARRANRIPWSRPIQILAPLKVTGRTVNVSAVGILLSLGLDCELKLGTQTSLMLPNVNGRDHLYLNGRIVRIERTSLGVQVAIDLAGM